MDVAAGGGVSVGVVGGRERGVEGGGGREDRGDGGGGVHEIVGWGLGRADWGVDVEGVEGGEVGVGD